MPWLLRSQQAAILMQLVKSGDILLLHGSRMDLSDISLHIGVDDTWPYRNYRDFGFFDSQRHCEMVHSRFRRPVGAPPGVGVDGGP